ncbi:hypothetical protein LTS08_002007 [Lithohypha guttulata]|nr:hypothetical protein LTS08_002007 [Lithohypha guttulata]
MELSIISLPPEILSQVLCRLSHTDLLAFSVTCRDAREHASPQNQLLWQAVFLQIFDDPRHRWDSLTRTVRQAGKDREVGWDWYNELRRRIVALRFVKSSKVAFENSNDPEAESVIEALLDIIDTAKTCLTPSEIQAGRKPEVDDRELSLNLGLLPIPYYFSREFDGLVRGLPASMVRRNAAPKYYEGDTSNARSMPGSWNEERTPGRPTTRLRAALEMEKAVRSAAGSRLHVLCGLTEYEVQDERALGRARRVTYDWTLTNSATDYGPFKNDGSGEIDWRRLEAVCSVVSRQFGNAIRGRMTPPQGFCFSLPYRTLLDPTTPNDWARVQGNWCGTYVFLHWEDLVDFNATSTDRPSLENGPEACGGVMKLELKLDDRIRDDPKLQTRLPICEDLPPLYFSGVSRSYDFQMATGIRGMACLAPGGKEVRWRYIVHYSGGDQWQLEGVQPGGIRSGSVYGLWTSCAHEQGGPVGPFCYAPEELFKPTSVVLVS